ncbi:hypothetical protein L6164_008264 [Bauhinia variegata]|uniref:Uncharacterized protein n=1 Tax=Bauhinia variegata TaxID=167791 RepID=A0ACB9PG93_BAUVA|nr:hypothetical protein L6164_008264 [Bauhinia variegata]
MTWALPKGSPRMSSRPRSISWIVVSVGGLALFLILASLVLVSSPIGATVQGYFYGVDSTQRLDVSIPSTKETTVDVHLNKTLDQVDNGVSSNLQSPMASSGLSSNNNIKGTDAKSNLQDNLTSIAAVPEDSSNLTQEVEAKAGTGTPNVTDNIKIDEPIPTINETSQSHDSISTTVPASIGSPNNATYGASIDSGCHLYHGKWIYDPSGSLYTNNSCPVITQMQNCQGNGRPDKDYENWRWKPFQCDIPRFDPRKFLELMRGKTLAFIGDSVARNQMESMLCILWQVEVPKNRGNRNMQRYYFRSTSVMIVRIWSSWLVKHITEPFDFAPAGVDKLHLDVPEEKLMEYIPKFDVVVLSSGHWFAKQSVYILDKEIVGGQLWWPDQSRPMKIDSVEAFGISVETILTAIATHPNYTGLLILRSFSPDHYEGGAWNTGGSCTGKVKPLAVGELVENEHINIMHEKQVTGFNQAIKKQTNKSKLRLMDMTEAFQYRHDGHPGPYRSPDPNKLTKRGPDGRPPPQDCLHWCMPGPVDTWNEIVFEIIKREYQARNSTSWKG